MEKYKIFMVEDDGVIAGQVKDYLEKWGYEVFCAKNFQDIMQEFAEINPHLVLMDIGLPFFNGH